MGEMLRRIDLGRALGLLALMVPVIFFWESRALWPLKVLVVFFHELSHGLAAKLTGGDIERIEVVAAQGGLCVTRGGSRFLILTAGYLGSLAWGGAILLLATRTRLDRALMVGLGALLLVASLLWVRPLIGFGFWFGLLAGVALAACGVYLKDWLNELVLQVIGLTSCLYALLDIKSDVLDRPELGSDARMLAELTHLPTRFWGALWIAAAALGALAFLALSCARGAGSPAAAAAPGPAAAPDAAAGPSSRPGG
jgi:hypothetical protein